MRNLIVICICTSTGWPSSRDGWYFQRRRASMAAARRVVGPETTCIRTTLPDLSMVVSMTTSPWTPEARAALGYTGITEEISFGSFTSPPILMGPVGRNSGDGKEAAFVVAIVSGALPEAAAAGSRTGACTDCPSSPRVEVVGRAVSALDIMSEVTPGVVCFAGAGVRLTLGAGAFASTVEFDAGATGAGPLGPGRAG